MAFFGNSIVASVPRTGIARSVVPCAIVTEDVPNRQYTHVPPCRHWHAGRRRLERSTRDAWVLANASARYPAPPNKEAEGELARAETVPPGHGQVQLRLRTGLTGEQYVTAQGWRDATLAHCPHHPGGGCSLARHGTYARKTPPGTRIARWYCRESQTTFSLLPDCLAARLPGTLAELEDAVFVAERATSLAAAANAVRRDPIELPGAMRWLSRRIRLVRRALVKAGSLLPAHLAGCPATVLGFRGRLGTDAALVRLREVAAPQLPALPPPLGYAHRPTAPGDSVPPFQQRMGRDPPRAGH